MRSLPVDFLVSERIIQSNAVRHHLHWQGIVEHATQVDFRGAIFFAEMARVGSIVVAMNPSGAMPMCSVSR